MFTGIIKAIAKVQKSERKKGSLFLSIEKPKNWKLEASDSIAVDGVCLTVKKLGLHDYLTELMSQTLKKTIFGTIVPKKVNLEQPMRLSQRIAGHIVLGHIDTVGRINKIHVAGWSKIYQIVFPNNHKHRKLVVAKGSVAIDGISLTIVDVRKNWFTVALTDYTIKHTTLGQKKVGDLVNLEFDIIAKYLDKLLWHKK